MYLARTVSSVSNVFFCFLQIKKKYIYIYKKKKKIKESWFFAYRSRKIQVMTFVLRCRFQWLTNRLPTFPFVPMVPMVPIDHSFSQGLQVLMRCSLQMVYRSTEELTIRSNGTNRKASLTNRNLLPMVPLVRVF